MVWWVDGRHHVRSPQLLEITRRHFIIVATPDHPPSLHHRPHLRSPSSRRKPGPRPATFGHSSAAKPCCRHSREGGNPWSFHALALRLPRGKQPPRATRKRYSQSMKSPWIPAFAGMTSNSTSDGRGDSWRDSKD